MADTPIDVISDTTAEATITAEAVVEITAEATTVGEASEAASEAVTVASEAASEAAAINLPVEYILDSIQVDHPMRAAIREELRAQIDPLREQLESIVKLLVR
jgi:thiamine pyrophosphate-dependent acetolactate synthase large subunit-like protein